MDKISEEMKTERDFIEKMEASSVKKEAIPKKSEADIEAYEFVTTFKELQDPLVPIMYRMQDAAVNTITKYISTCFKNFHSAGNRSGGYNNSSNYGGEEEFSDSPF